MKQDILKLQVVSPGPGSTNAYFVVVVVVWSGKGQTVNNLRCVGYTVSVTTIRLHCHGAKAVTDKTGTNGCGSFPKK